MVNCKQIDRRKNCPSKAGDKEQLPEQHRAPVFQNERKPDQTPTNRCKAQAIEVRRIFGVNGVSKPRPIKKGYQKTGNFSQVAMWWQSYEEKAVTHNPEPGRILRDQ